jgi:hypothetical protein
MNKLPIIYCDTRVGYVSIDSDIEFLDTFYIAPTVSNRLRKLCDFRSDLVCATFIENSIELKRSRPFFRLINTSIFVAHVAVCEPLQTLLRKHLFHHSYPDLRSRINQARSSIHRISYADGDRTNCTKSNLRVVRRPEEWDMSILSSSPPQRSLNS